MQPSGAKRNSEDHATFSKAGPYLRSPETTRSPNVIPNKYKFKKSSINDGPNLNNVTPKKDFIHLKCSDNKTHYCTNKN